MSEAALAGETSKAAPGHAKAKRLAIAVIASVIAALIFKGFVADVYLVESGSMEPTIFGGEERGERVLVRYQSNPTLKRYDLVVLRRNGVPVPAVKRVVGLPGESVQIRAGDIYVNGRLLALEHSGAPWIDLFDSTRQDFAQAFQFESGAEAWVQQGAEWQIGSQSDAAPVVEEGENWRLIYKRGLDDGYITAGGEPVVGTSPVGDGRIDLELVVQDSVGELLLELGEAADVFQARLRFLGEECKASLCRASRLKGAAPSIEILELGSAKIPAGESLQVSFSNRDNLLQFKISSQAHQLLDLIARYDANYAPPGKTLVAGAAIGPQVQLSGINLHAKLQRLRVRRDLHYVGIGEHGVARPLSLGPDQLFVLGDNSMHSADGRLWGATPMAEIMGLPKAVVWPLEQARWLSESATE